MCIAILTKEGAIMDNAALYRGWAGNSDGAGFAYVAEGKVKIEKGFMKYAEFQKAYVEASSKYAADSPFLIHMRIRTSGATNQNNCHPFPIKGGAMIHNGIMFTPTGKRVGKPEDRRSDTRVFAEDLYNILQLETLKKAGDDIRKAVGNSNKLAFLYDDKQFLILGESLGTWSEGIWYSNGSCAVSGRYSNG